eukprot:13644687-Ditylum_brightwellii.AAC.1
MGILTLYYLLDGMAEYQQTTVDQKLTIHVDNMAAVRTSNKDITPGIRYHLMEEQMDHIDWDTHGKALQCQPTMLQI